MRLETERLFCRLWQKKPLVYEKMRSLTKALSQGLNELKEMGLTGINDLWGT